MRSRGFAPGVGRWSLISILFFVAGFFLFCFFFYQRLQWLFQQNFPPSNNGYFYLVELRSWIGDGHSFYGKFSLFFPTAAFFARLLNVNEITTFYLSVLISLFMLSIALVLFCPDRKKFWIWPWLFLLPWLSDVIFYRHNAFLKQSISISAFLLGFSLLLYVRSGKSHVSLRRTLSVVCGILLFWGMCSHMFTFVLGSIFLPVVFLRHWQDRIVALNLLIVALYLLLRVTGKDLLSAPHLLILTNWTAMFRKNSDEYYLAYEMLAAGSFWIVTGILALFVKRFREQIFILFFCTILLFLLPIWDETSSMSLRLFISAFWILYALLARFAYRMQGVFESVCYGLFLVSFVAASLFAGHERFGNRGMGDGLLPQYTDELSEWIHPQAFVRAPMGVQFAVTYHLQRSSSDDPPTLKSFSGYYRISRYKPEDSVCHLLEKGVTPSGDLSCVRAGRKWTVRNLVVDKFPAEKPEERAYSIGHAQSHISVFQNKPLISANFHGRFRPYLFQKGSLRELPVETSEQDAPVDLYTPLPLDEDRILFTGSLSGRRDFDLYLYSFSTQTLSNITQSPQVDDGNVCISPEKSYIAFRSGNHLEVRKSATPYEKTSLVPFRAFHRCAWISENILAGVTTPWKNPALHVCTHADIGKFECIKTDVLSDTNRFLAFGNLNSSRVGLIQRENGEEWYRSYKLLQHNDEELRVEKIEFEGQADVLQNESGLIRIGRDSHYYLSDAISEPAIVSTVNNLEGTLFGIVSDRNHPRTLAVRDGISNEWHYYYPEDFKLPKHPPQIRSEWISDSESNEQYQLIVAETDTEAASHTVLWLHGGPHENVSPRYHGYFHALTEAGVRVVALNYPGSSGRGVSYENQFDTARLLQSLKATMNWIHRHYPRSAVSVWSISTGGEVVRRMLAANVEGVDSYIIQAAADPFALYSLSSQHQKRAFFIHGAHDRGISGDKAFVDYLYEGGHDITREFNFQQMVDRVLHFLKKEP